MEQDRFKYCPYCGDFCDYEKSFVCDGCGATGPFIDHNTLDDWNHRHEPNEALSLDELERMDGKPVCLFESTNEFEYALVDCEEKNLRMKDGACIDWGASVSYGRKIYPHKPTTP